METLSASSTLPRMVSATATSRLNSRAAPPNRCLFHSGERRRRRRAASLRLRLSAADDGRRNPGPSSDPIEVIGIGSRKDSVIDFCLNYRSNSSSRMRFWTIQKRDSNGVQLLQRCRTTDVVRNVEFPLSEYPCPPAVILVASSGHGLEHITGMELLNSAKAAGGLTVAIILEPFSFEGRRRQEEVENLINELEDCSHFQILVKSDSLVKRDVETFAEALEIVNNAVYLALSSIVLVSSENCMKFQNSSSSEIRDLRPTEIIEILEAYRQAKVGYGAGYDLQSAVKQAISHAPFVNGCLEDLNGVVMLTLTCASLMDDSDLVSAIISFRKISDCKSKIVVSAIQEPDLESNLIVITILTLGIEETVIPQKKRFWSGLAVHFPFLSFLIGKDISEPDSNLVASSSSGSSEEIISGGGTNISEQDCVNGTASYLDSFSEEMESTEELDSVSTVELSSKTNDVSVGTISNTKSGSEHSNDLGFHIAQQWAKERASVDLTNLADEKERFTLPVGVKTSTPCSDHSTYPSHAHAGVLDDMNSTGVLFDTKTVGPIDALADTGFEAVQDMYKSALTFIKGKSSDETRSGGLLSARAASMLEAERELEKSWCPTVTVQYRGGTYRGRCQGGLPEGKGRLMFADGSFYDGMWRNGKRCGVGILCYGNGDVYQGTWRDDLMHGKGWFYFHTGDRWFANFWKGKANGEGRFYSKNGSIFFGHFKDGWRHGQFLCIDIDGSRWAETWEEGARISRTQLDKDA